MRRITLVGLISLSFVFCFSAQEKTESQSGNTQTVDYCALRKNPEVYNGKSIRVRGIWERGFEVSAFYDKACFDDSYYARHETWVEFFRREICSDKDNTSAIVKTFLSGKAGGELEVTLTGVFRGSKDRGGFGHLGGYNFQIDVSCIEEAKLLPDEVSGCRRIDPTKPFHYLSYEKMEKGTPPRFEKSKQPKSENLIFLRLANNSTCPIRVPTIDNPDTRDLKDQSEIPVIYTLSSPCSSVSWRSPTQRKQTLSVLSPGKSIYFAVPLRLLTKEPYDIRIPFDSGIVKDSSYYQPFYFSRDDLPEDLRKDVDCTKY